MTRAQWIDSISKEELALRMYGKDIFNRACWECVFYKKDQYGHYKCVADNIVKDNCEEQFEQWLQENMDGD